MLSQAFLDELRARTVLSALIGRTVKLSKAGNEWKACCPFHNEKTASFYVNDEKGFYHCFGCQAHGDAMRWLTDERGLEFMDAVKQLADATGMDMPARDTPEEPVDESAYMVLQHAALWFREQLMGIEGGPARAYLQRRGIGQAAIDHFGIGLAPESRSRLRQALSDFGDQALVEAGLVIDVEEREPYDRFRSRIIFPIRDTRGRVVGFGGRILGDGEPKYLNSPETALFDKGRSLFNLDRAAALGRKAGRLIVVEGYMDVVGLWQAGLEETVAVNGTALTEAQIALLWRVTAEPLVCFDGDAAGVRAAAKAAIRALPGIQPGRTLQFVGMPSGLDPDDVARSGGKRALDQLLSLARPLVDVLWEHEVANGPLRTPEARAALRGRLQAHTAAITSDSLRKEYDREFGDRIWKLFAPGAKRKAAKGPRTTPAPDPAGIRVKMVTAVLRGLVRHPDVLMAHGEDVASLPCETDAQRQAVERLTMALFAGEPMPTVAEIDELFPDARSWHGFQFSFMIERTWPRRAVADLEHYLTCLVAQGQGATVEQLTQMAREYVPPTPADNGRLL